MRSACPSDADQTVRAAGGHGKQDAIVGQHLLRNVRAGPHEQWIIDAFDGRLIEILRAQFLGREVDGGPKVGRNGNFHVSSLVNCRPQFKAFT